MKFTPQSLAADLLTYRETSTQADSETSAGEKLAAALIKISPANHIICLVFLSSFCFLLLADIYGKTFLLLLLLLAATVTLQFFKVQR